MDYNVPEVWKVTTSRRKKFHHQFLRRLPLPVRRMRGGEIDRLYDLEEKYFLSCGLGRLARDHTRPLRIGLSRGVVLTFPVAWVDRMH
jgi:hypothetical protein